MFYGVRAWSSRFSGASARTSQVPGGAPWDLGLWGCSIPRGPIVVPVWDYLIGFYTKTQKGTTMVPLGKGIVVFLQVR